MTNETDVEKTVSPELSPVEVLAQMSKKADEVIIDSQTTTERPSPYFGVENVVSETGIETSSLRGRTADLIRTRDPETGTTSYKMSVLYYHSGDRGAFRYAWSTLEPTISYSVNSELTGLSEPELKTEPADIRSVQSMLESHFPERATKQDEKKQSFAHRILARLKK